MKNTILSIITVLGMSYGAKADVLGDQVVAALTNHATFAAEYRHGSKNLILSDSVIEIGKLKKDYISAIDLGLNGATLPGESESGIQFTTGLRLNVHAFVKQYVPLKPEWEFLNHFEYYVRGYYNWSEDIWFGSANIGYGFGKGTGQ